MAGLGDIVQKAVYLGVGLASYAGEKATEKLGELRNQAQKLADEMVKRGEMTTEEASKFVEDFIQQAQQQQPVKPADDSKPPEPRMIEIIEEDEESSAQNEQNVDNLRQQVESLQEELRRLQRD